MSWRTLPVWKMTDQSEGELLEEVLGALDDPHMQFKLGKLMGIMSKGNRGRIAHLERELESMRKSRDGFVKLYFDLKKEKGEHQG